MEDGQIENGGPIGDQAVKGRTTCGHAGGLLARTCLPCPWELFGIVARSQTLPLGSLYESCFECWHRSYCRGHT